MGSPQDQKLLNLFEEHYPEARCSLNYRDPYELLVATILSAQCTDERVNKTTPAFFERFPGPAELAGGEAAEVEELIRSTGFFRNKAKSLLGMARAVVERPDGDVPDNLKELVKLPGVGRKTANVVLGNAFDVPGVVVDTHVGRIARRIGWSREKNPEKVERDLMKIWPRERWTRLGHQLIAHGRTLCQARKPLCGDCFARPYCDFGAKEATDDRS